MFQVLRHDVDRASGRTHGGIGAWDVLHWRQTHWDHHAHSRLSMLKPKGGARHPPRRRRRRRLPVSQPDPPRALRALHPGARCSQRAGKSHAPSYAHSAHAYVHTAPMFSPFFSSCLAFFAHLCTSLYLLVYSPIPPSTHPFPPLTAIRFSPVNEQAESAVVLVHPTCGPTQPGDIPGSVRFRTYEVLQDEIKASLLYINPILSSSHSFPIYAHAPILPIGFLYIYIVSSIRFLFTGFCLQDTERGKCTRWAYLPYSMHMGEVSLDPINIPPACPTSLSYLPFPFVAP